MSSKDLNERYLESGDLAVHEDTGQVQLHLETNVHLQEGGRETMNMGSMTKTTIKK